MWWFSVSWLLAAPAAAAVFRVGDTISDTCDYASIQEAIDAGVANGPGADTIVVANTGTYAGVALVVTDQSLAIDGGYDSCAHQAPAAAADIRGNGADPVLRIAPDPAGAQAGCACAMAAPAAMKGRAAAACTWRTTSC